MLIEFRVENYRSLRDEQALTFEAAPLGDPDDPRPRTVEGHGERLLPAAVIYGANASGKSNVLAALAFMRAAVVNSHRRWDPEGGVPRSAFAWGDKRSEPSTFEATFLLEGTKYQYGFVVDDQAVREEWLSAWPKHREQVWLEREDGSFTFGERLEGSNDAVKSVTRPNALFLSTAAQLGHEQLTRLYTWFRRIFPVNVQAPPMNMPGGAYRVSPGVAFAAIFPLPGDEPENALSKGVADESAPKRIRELLRAADVGICDVKRVDDETELRGRKYRRQRIQFRHNADNDDSWLDLEEESGGTRTLFLMAPSIFGALDSGGLLLVDELESSLHPLLGLAIVGLFNSPKTNPRNAQILFTTHDTNLLGNAIGEPLLRRDQVWFTEKDKDGATRLYPLTDYKPRKAENLERGYLQGRYGAIPYLGGLEWMTE
jgi:AAA15 family ATPase/GTPase